MIELPMQRCPNLSQVGEVANPAFGLHELSNHAELDPERMSV